MRRAARAARHALLRLCPRECPCFAENKILRTTQFHSAPSLVRWGPLLVKGWFRIQVPLRGPVVPSPPSPPPGGKNSSFPMGGGAAHVATALLILMFCFFLIAAPSAAQTNYWTNWTLGGGRTLCPLLLDVLSFRLALAWPTVVERWRHGEPLDARWNSKARERGTSSGVTGGEKVCQTALVFFLEWKVAACAGRVGRAAPGVEEALDQPVRPDEAGEAGGGFMCFGTIVESGWLQASRPCTAVVEPGISSEDRAGVLHLPFFLASHCRCMEASAEPKISSGTIGMSRMLSFSLSDRLARLSHHTRSCRTIVPSAFPVA